MIRVGALYVHPLKGAAGIRVPRWPLDAFGPRLDRRWMIVDEHGTFVSQRSTPALARIRTSLEDDALVLEAEGQTLALPLEGPSRSGAGLRARTVDIWGDGVEALPATDPPGVGDRWISRVLGRPLHVVRMPDDARRPVPVPPEGPLEGPGADGTPPRVSFADGYPLLVVSEASLNELNRRLRDAGESPVPMDRFRPNVVVTGTPPHDEDTWRDFNVGPVPFRGLKGCARCSVTTVDQATGETSSEPLRTLATYRRGPGPEGKVWFGQNAVHLELGELAEGMAVEVRRRGPPMGPPASPG
ncbi:MAG: MOSC domain-containing protein [Gemmatimonadales bacterium]|nr:MAG: MOSC domain-containing protein [Gemmatimonadales bacterium]